MVFTWGSSFYLLSVLAGPISDDTGWSPAWVVGALSLGLLLAGLLSPRVGDLISEHGGRPVLSFGCLAIAAGLTVVGLAPVLPVYLLGWLLLGAGMAAGLYDAGFAALGKLYGKEARRAISTLTLWGGFASTATWPLSAYLVGEYGWRVTCLAYAAIMLLVCLPLIRWQLPAVSASGRIQARAAADHVPLNRTERRQFTLLAAIQVNAGLISTIIAVHVLVLLQGRGLSLAEAVALGALIGPAQVAGRLAELAGGQRYHPMWTLTAAVILFGVGLLLLSLGASLAGVAISLYGAGNGILSIARGSLPLALFGPERYGPLLGRLARPALAAAATAPTLGALLITWFGGDGAFLTVALLAAVNIVLLVFLWRVRN